jgi:sRNA-binding regulator protein Hfq
MRDENRNHLRVKHAITVITYDDVP